MIVLMRVVDKMLLKKACDAGGCHRVDKMIKKMQ
jgi:hypothetical protein